MVRHFAVMIAATSLIIACMFYPFLPGGYDGLAVTLSAMAQLFGMAGLLLVPLGVAWLAYECRRWATGSGARPGRDIGYRFGWASIGVSSFVAVVVSLGATIDARFSLGLGVVALWAYGASRLAARLRALGNAAVWTFNPAPVYLIVLPAAAAAFKFALVAPAAEFSRNRVIDNSAALIADIERFRDAHGHYPRSLQSVWEDYKPGVVGVDRYHYEPNGEGYNVYFGHFSAELDVKEIVMFNRRGEHEFTSHNADLLRYTAARLARSRGYVSVRDAARPHWKSFLFD